MEQTQYWAYRDTLGNLHVEEYTNEAEINAAWGSDLVDDVYGPFPASSKAEAMGIAKENLLGR